MSENQLRDDIETLRGEIAELEKRVKALETTTRHGLSSDRGSIGGLEQSGRPPSLSRHGPPGASEPDRHS